MKLVIQILILMNLGGGTWVEDTIGYTTVGADTVGDSELHKHNLPSINVGTKVGEMNHALTIEEMPSHYHPANNFVYNPAAATGNKHTIAVGSGNSVIAYDINGDINLKVNNTGGSQSHNNMQPSIGVIRWHRIT